MSLRKWLSQLTADTRPRGETAPPPELAVAILLIECARADFDHTGEEIEEVRKALSKHFGISAANVDQMIADAGKAASDAVSLHGPISRLNDTFSAPEKRSLMETLWRVALADGRIDAHEEHLLRQIADLLFLPHAEFIQAKLTVTESQ